jgi:hypothetical protein
MNTPCEKSEVINIIREDVKEIRKDVKDLVSFKAKVIGIQIGISFVITVLFNLLILIIKK